MTISDEIARLPKPPAPGFYQWPPGQDGWESIDAPSGGGRVELSYRHRRSDDDDPFGIATQFAYYDGASGYVVVVPHDPADNDPGRARSEFVSDLTSIPQLVSWFVPPIGEHLRPALVHDALVVGGPPTKWEWDALGVIQLIVSVVAAIGAFWFLLGPDQPLTALGFAIIFALFAWETPPDRPLAEGLTHHGPLVGRVTADRIFRDAMALDGTSWLRRSLMWSAVTAATLWDSPNENWIRRLRWMLLDVVTFGGIIALGALATLDLFDVGSVEYLPWMGEEEWTTELWRGGLMAVLVPAGLAIAWWRLYPAAFLGGVAFALLFHVTILVLTIYGLYLAIDRLADAVLRWSRRGEG